MEVLRDSLVAIVENEHPTTVRHVFYRAVAAGLIPKTEEAYKRVVVRLLTQLRRGGRIPYGWISDNTRWVIRSRTYGSMVEVFEDFATRYRLNLWDSADVRVEVWTEKDAVAGVLSDVADRWCVPTMVFRGYSSVSYLYALAEEIRQDRKPTYIYYFGDHDPSGQDIERYVVRTVREMVPEAEIHVKRVAVTRRQIKKFNLPTRPTKRTDSRAAKFMGRSVEIDALDPPVLQEMVEAAILRHLDMDEVARLRVMEEAGRVTFKQFAEHWDEGR